MTRRTPGRTAGLDNRRSTRSPSFPSRNTPAMGGNDPDRYRLSGMRPCGGLVTVTKYGPDPNQADTRLPMIRVGPLQGVQVVPTPAVLATAGSVCTARHALG